MCFGAKPTQKTEDEISRETGSGGGKEGPREDRERRWQRKAEENGRLEIAVQGKDGQQKGAVREDSQRWVSIPSVFVEVSHKIHAHDSQQMNEKLPKDVT